MKVSKTMHKNIVIIFLIAILITLMASIIAFVTLLSKKYEYIIWIEELIGLVIIVQIVTAICVLHQLEDRKQWIEMISSQVSICGKLILNENDLIIHDVDQKAIDILNVKKEELVGYRWEDLVRKVDDGNKVLKDEFVDKYHMEEYAVSWKGRDEIPLMVNQSTILLDRKKYIVMSFLDITEIKNKDKRLNKMQDKVFQTTKLESVGTLAAGIAHEINSPIQFVSNNNIFLEKAVNQLLKVHNEIEELLKSDISIEEYTIKRKRALKKHKIEFLKEEIPRAIEQTQEGIDRIAEIVKAMKNFSHMGSGEKAYGDINEAVKTTLIISKNEWKYDAKLDVEYSENLPQVYCDIGDIKQVLLNLIINAVHTIKEKKLITKEDGKITIKTYALDNSVFIEIQDSGMGIKEQDKDKVFQPFFTTKKVGVGTGQGLRISQRIVCDKHNGNLTFETKENEGTTFKVELPISDEGRDANE